MTFRDQFVLIVWILKHATAKDFKQTIILYYKCYVIKEIKLTEYYSKA